MPPVGLRKLRGHKRKCSTAPRRAGAWRKEVTPQSDCAEQREFCVVRHLDPAFVEARLTFSKLPVFSVKQDQYHLLLKVVLQT